MSLQIFYRNSVGLEFSDYFLNAVKLRKNGKRVKLIAKASVQLPYNLNPQTESEFIVEALKKLYQEINFDIEDVLVVNVKADNILFRKISLPKMKKAQTINAAKFQINRELMIPVEEIVIDTYEIETKNNMIDYGVFIARKTHVDSLVHTLKEAGFEEPDVIDVDYLKYLYLVDTEKLTGYNFIVVESLEGVFVMLVVNGRLLLIETSSMTLDDIVNTLSNKYGITVDEALSILKNGSEIGAFGKQVAELLEFHYRETVYEIEKLLRSVMVSNEIPQNVKVKVFLLSLNERLTNEFVKYANEIGLIDGSSILTFPFRKNVPVSSVPLGALGLAYRGVMEIGKGEFVSKEKAKVKV